MGNRNRNEAICSFAILIKRKRVVVVYAVSKSMAEGSIDWLIHILQSQNQSEIESE